MQKKSTRCCLLACLLCSVIPLSHANEDDTQQIRDQQKLELYQQEQEIVKDAKFPDEAIEYLSVDGKRFVVADTESDLTRAIFISINRRQWDDVERFLLRYQQLEPHAEVVVLFAQGAIARAQGKLYLAEDKFRQMLAIDPEFVRGKLELARLLFENKKNRESAQLFTELYDQVPAQIQRPIQQHLQALRLRKRWRSYVSLGMSYNNNVNQKSGQTECYATFEISPSQSFCITRSSEQPETDRGWDFTAAVSKDYQIHDNHNLFFKGLWYGTIYDTESQHSHQTLQLSSGYKFANAKHSFALSPLYEKYLWSADTLYNGYGVRLEYSYLLGKRDMLSLQIDYQHNLYINDRYANNYDGDVYTSYLTWNHQFLPSLMGFVGININKKDLNSASSSYDLLGGRLGLNKSFKNGSNISFTALYREYDYKAANVWIGVDANQNKEQLYYVNYNLPNLAYKGFYPSVMYKYSKVHSNNDWYYGYSNTELSFKIQKNF